MGNTMYAILKSATIAISLSVWIVSVSSAGVHWSLPYDRKRSAVLSLYQLVDKNLEARLVKAVNTNPRWRTLVRMKKMAVGIVDIGDPDAVRFARVNGQVMMYAASLPKIAVLLASIQAFEEKRLKETPAVLSDLRGMISHSDNAAATRMIDRLGFDYIAKVLTASQYRFYNAAGGGGLWVGKRYAATGERHPEQLQGLSHAATVTQVCRFYYLLSMGKLVNRQRSRQMLEMLADPELHHKFVGVLEKRVPEATLFRKSGTWKIWHADSVLVWGPAWRRYIAVALVEDPDGEGIMKALITVIDKLLERENQRKAISDEGGCSMPANAGWGRNDLLTVLADAAAAIEDY